MHVVCFTARIAFGAPNPDGPLNGWLTLTAQLRMKTPERPEDSTNFVLLTEGEEFERMCAALQAQFPEPITRTVHGRQNLQLNLLGEVPAAANRLLGMLEGFTPQTITYQFMDRQGGHACTIIEEQPATGAVRIPFSGSHFPTPESMNGTLGALQRVGQVSVQRGQRSHIQVSLPTPEDTLPNLQHIAEAYLGSLLAQDDTRQPF